MPVPRKPDETWIPRQDNETQDEYILRRLRERVENYEKTIAWMDSDLRRSRKLAKIKHGVIEKLIEDKRKMQEKIDELRSANAYWKRMIDKMGYLEKMRGYNKKQREKQKRKEEKEAQNGY